MFILRTITPKEKGNAIINRSIGEWYEVVNKAKNKGRVELHVNMEKIPDPEKVRAIVLYQKGDNEEFIPLYDYYNYFIMTPSGKTFERL